MSKLQDPFFELECLTEQSFQVKGLSLHKKWFKSSDKRYISETLQKFIQYNINQFKFIGVEPYLVGTDQNTSIFFKSSSYIGAVPLRASDTGKQIGDFVVSPRFIGKNKYEDYIGILNLLDKEIEPDFYHGIPLCSGRNFRPPLYLEAIKFINLLHGFLRENEPWRKFEVYESYSSQPTGQIDWNKYAQSLSRIENTLRYPVTKSRLSERHSDYSEIMYVFDISKKEINGAYTPQRLKHLLRSKLDFITTKTQSIELKRTQEVKLKASDSPKVKGLKIQANKILNFEGYDSNGWRVDYSEVFERYIQHLFKDISKEIGARFYANHKIQSQESKYFGWSLRHLEPDGVLQKDNVVFYIDAKYKSHMYNKFDSTDLLNADHRHDLHQIMAYASFSESKLKFGVLCYPAQEFEVRTLSYKNQINLAENQIIIIGIPLKVEEKMNAKEKIKEVLTKLDAKLSVI